MCTLNRSERTTDRLNQLIAQYLEKRALFRENPGWTLRESDTGGFGVFATKDFDAGEVIFWDSPVIIGPRCIPNCPRICVNCFSKINLYPCTKNCGLDICSQACQTSPIHLKECKYIRQNCQTNIAIATDFCKNIFENLTPIRSLFLDQNDKDVISCLIAHDSNEHGREIDFLKTKLGFQFKEDEEAFMRFVCCVLDANAFEVAIGNEDCQSSVRGLYPLGSLANHSCVANTTHVFDENQHMVVKAAVFISKDTELFHTYTRIIWGSSTRLFHLHRTKHFICKCPRCSDPTEFGTYMGSVLCKLCRGIVSPVNPYKTNAKWQCRDCKNVIRGKEAGELFILLGTILRNIEPSDFPFMHKLLNGKLKSVVPEYNQVTIELKYKIVWVLGHKDGYKWSELPYDLLELKEQICNDMLGLLEQLRCGQCKMRGLLLFELFCCQREVFNRNCKSKQKVPQNMLGLMREAASILEYDVTAPEEIKEMLNGHAKM